MTSKFWFCLLCLCSLVCTHLAYANVIMTGTRVIFPAEHQEKTLQFSNNGDLSFLVQVWLDQGNEQSTPETADAPFIVNPQVFRVNPHSGQMVRLVYVGDHNLPQDQESLFYLNFKQIPSLEKTTQDENRLVLLVKSRLKVFYRPKSIIGKVENLPKQLSFSLYQDQQGSWLEVNNPTGYYANPTQAIVKIGSQEIKAKNVSMIAPKSSTKWQLEQSISSTHPAQVSIRLVNDYGAYVNHDIKPKQ